MSFPLCETIEDYEPNVDVENQCLRDMNLSDIKKKYGSQKSFRCCGTDYTPKKRYQFIHSHIGTEKHKKFLSSENEKHKQTYGSFTDPNEMFCVMRKEIRELKTQLHYKNEESRFKDEEISKLKSINSKMHEVNATFKSKERKISKKLTIVPVHNLIDM